MRIVQHETGDYGMKVWLDSDEIDQLLDIAENSERMIAYSLGSKCGLRSQEWLSVKPEHIVSTDAGKMLRVVDGKGGEERMTPVPPRVESSIRVVGEYSGEGSEIVSVDSTRSVQRWLNSDTERLADSTGIASWANVTTHDLRRSWTTNLLNAGVNDRSVMKWGGWEDIVTMVEAYDADAWDREYSPEAQKREREKVEWLG